MINKESKNNLRRKRHARIRRSLSGTSERPRLVIYRSLRHIYAQIIDDMAGKTLVAANTLQKDVKEAVTDGMSPKEMAKTVGKIIGKKAVETGLTQVVFDRAGYKYHGSVAALAEGARDAGLKF